MKARIVKTGEIVEGFTFGKGFISLKDGVRNMFYDIECVELLSDEPEPDWNQIKIQASITAMQGILANQDWPKSANIPDDFDEYKERVALASVEFADSLITELKKQTE